MGETINLTEETPQVETQKHETQNNDWSFKHSEQIAELFAALAAAQGKIENATKDADNPFHNSHYSDLASVRNVIQQPMAENGLCVIQGTELTASGTMILVTTIGHKSGQWVRCYYRIISGKRPKGSSEFVLSNDPQSLGSAITYARRYMLMAMTGVAPADDDGEGAMNRNGNGKDKQQNPAPTRKQQNSPSAKQTASPVKQPNENDTGKTNLTPTELKLRSRIANYLLDFHNGDKDLAKAAIKEITNGAYDDLRSVPGKNIVFIFNTLKEKITVYERVVGEEKFLNASGENFTTQPTAN